MAQGGQHARGVRARSGFGLGSERLRALVRRARALEGGAQGGSLEVVPVDPRVDRVRGERVCNARRDPAAALRLRAQPAPPAGAGVEEVIRWALCHGGAVPNAGGSAARGWAWLFLEGRLPAKNRIAGAAGRGRKFFKPKRIVEAEGRVRRAAFTAFQCRRALFPPQVVGGNGPKFVGGGVEHFERGAFEYRLVIFRRTPLEARTGARNPARGDPASSHEFLIDALQGFFYANDECLVRGSFEEIRCMKADGYLFFVRPVQEPSDGC